MRIRHLLLCGLCLSVGIWSQQASAQGAAAAPSNYRQLIADSDVVAILRAKLNLVAPLTVSQLRPSVLTQLGDWNACLRVASAGFKNPPPPAAPNAASRQPGLPPVDFYIYFFADGAIVDSRPAVAIDRCADVAYSPLPALSKKKKPN